jgi:hypothetical protein
VGTHLFDRTPDGVLPTVVAEALGPHAEAMERAASGLALAAQEREIEPEGEVRLTAPPGIAQFIVAPALPQLLQSHPRLRVSLDASIAYADLTRREADLALRNMRPTSGDLLVKKLGDVTGGVYGAPRYAAELGTLRRLDDARWINWGEVSPTSRGPSSWRIGSRLRESCSAPVTWAHSSPPRPRGSGSCCAIRKPPGSVGSWTSDSHQRCADRCRLLPAASSGSSSIARCGRCRASPRYGASSRRPRTMRGSISSSNEGSMTFGTIGAGAVALAFAREALARGHEVVLSSRRGGDALADKVAELGRSPRPRSRKPRASSTCCSPYLGETSSQR